jgi:hypothetical protein
MLNLITSLVVATSVAHPVVTVNQPSYTVVTQKASEPCEQPAAQPVILKQVQTPVTKYHAPKPHWTALSGSLQLQKGKYDYVRVGAQAGSFTTLELKNLSGKNDIKQMTIDFADGRSQVVRLDKTLDGRDPVLTVDLAGTHGRQIQRIVIAGQSTHAGSYELFAI